MGGFWLHRTRHWPVESRSRFAAALSRWRRGGQKASDELTPSSREGFAGGPSHPHHHRIELLPGHLVDVPQASHSLLHELKCDDWFVACRNDHQCVVRLTRGGIPHYAVSFQCTPAVDKAIYHGSRAWSVSIVPLENEADLDAETLHRVKAGLAGLNKGPATT